MKPCIFYGFNRIDFISFDEDDDYDEPLTINQNVPVQQNEAIICTPHKECFIFPEKNIRKMTNKHIVRVENVDNHSILGNLIE